MSLADTSEREELGRAWEARVSRLLGRLPDRITARIVWLRHPDRRAIRIVAAVLLVCGGLLSILPVLGIWMLPLGLALLAEDWPGLKPKLENAARLCERVWRRLRPDKADAKSGSIPPTKG